MNGLDCTYTLVLFLCLWIYTSTLHNTFVFHFRWVIVSSPSFVPLRSVSGPVFADRLGFCVRWFCLVQSKISLRSWEKPHMRSSSKPHTWSEVCVLLQKKKKIEKHIKSLTCQVGDITNCRWHTRLFLFFFSPTFPRKQMATSIKVYNDLCNVHFKSDS